MNTYFYQSSFFRKTAKFTTVLVLLFTFAVGCAISPPKDNMFSVGTDGGPTDPGTGDIISGEQFNEHIDTLLREDEDNFIIYIHGGLNTQRTSKKRVAALSTEIQRDGYHPIFLNWQSGIGSTYAEHVFKHRQGVQWGFLGAVSSPFIILADLGRSLTRTPITWGYKFLSTVKTLPFPKSTRELAVEKTNKLITEKDIFAEAPILKDDRRWYNKTIDVVFDSAQFIPGLITSPLFDAVGSGGWNIMKRRTTVMFQKSLPQRDFDDLDLESWRKLNKGATSVFFDRLVEFQKKHPDVEVSLVGHSMGTIIIDSVLRNYPELKLENIIYMAAASSIEDFQRSVIPYLKLWAPKDAKQKPDDSPQFYNLMLHPIAENSDNYGFGFGGTGSLLNQIDDIYENPQTKNQRTLGKYVNVMNSIDVFHDSISKRIHLRVMPNNRNYPTKHGQFDEVEYIRVGKFWRGDLGANPAGK